MKINNVLEFFEKEFDAGNKENAIQLVKLMNDVCNQQNEKIKELEEENKELEIKLDKCGTELVNAESLVSYLENENRQLRQQLTITEKALELACEEIGVIEAKFGSAYIRANGYLLDYFKTEAKEMLENE